VTSLGSPSVATASRAVTTEAFAQAKLPAMALNHAATVTLC
jgi:hypothetical protein